MAALLTVSGLAVVTTAPPADAATASLRIDKSAPATALVGDDITFQVKASNPLDDGDADFQYNLTFRDVLPEGATYVSTSSPTGAGDPRQIAELDALDAPTGRTILIWTNVADLPDGSDVTLTYKVRPDADVYPVGSTLTNEAAGFVSSAERTVPKFSATGTFTGGAAITQHADTATSAITALQLTKSEPSSEHELVRGVLDRGTVYTVTVTNNAKASTQDVTVVDYLPAGLELLDCAACLPPTSVTTVDDDLPVGFPAGVYTRVEWTLPDLTAGGTSTIKYAAGIPLRENVMPATSGFDPTNNLDNNTGASTRETTSEIGYTNRAVATGRYQGSDHLGATDTVVTARDQLTVTAEDIAVAKTVSSETFEQGGVAEYELLVRTSEYTDGSDIRLSDTLPDGLCPSDAPESAYTDAAKDNATGDCAPTGTNDAIKTVDFSDDAFTITFEPFALSAAEGSTTLQYQARMRSIYFGGEKTSAGDSFVNTVTLTGTTTPIAGTGESDAQHDVADTSQATLGSSAPSLDKRILRNTAAPHSCDDGTWSADPSVGSWRDDQTAAADDGFTVGSRVCFQVRVVFPATSSTRLPVITDYLPDNLAYEQGSFELVSGINTAHFDVDHGALDAGFADGTASLRPGSDVGNKRYVERGQVFAFQLSAIVQANDTAGVDVQGNLAKLRWTDRAGRAMGLRDKADFKVPPVPPLSIDKRVDGVSSKTAVHDDVVRYGIAVTNGGTVPVGDIEVWDTLPFPYRCADVTSISNGGVCTNPGAAEHLSFGDNGVQSAIRWTLAPAVAAGASTAVTYDVTLPTSMSAGTRYTNSTGVVKYSTTTNRDGVSEVHYPRENISPLVPAADRKVPAAKDTASVELPAVKLVKTNVTPVVGGGNSITQAVPGELVTYSIRATVPARTTVYSGVVNDVLPVGLTFVSSTGKFSATAADPAADDLPPDTVLSGSRLSLPVTWTNASSTDQVFALTIVARVNPGLTVTEERVNTATFTSKASSAVDAPSVSPREATSTVNIVQPSPTLTKTLATTTPAQTTRPLPGETRDFVLKASNAAGRPTLFDSVVVDCVPKGLTVTNLGTDATQAPPAEGDACAGAAGTVITWNVGPIVAGAANAKTLNYQVSIDLLAAGGQAYQNTATLTGSTLDNSLSAPGVKRNDRTNERVITSAKSLTLTVPLATTIKSVADDTLTIGELAEYTVTATFPAGINFYNAAVVDTLPLGIDVSTLVTTSVACRVAGADCAPTVSGAALTRSGQNVGWYVGDLASHIEARTVTIKYTAKVTDTCRTATTEECNTIGTVRTNRAVAKWNLTSKTTPTSASMTFDKVTATPAAANVTIQEPATAITKTVLPAKPAPGETFTYTVTASNPGGTNVSDAYDVVVKDVVPVGVVVDQPSITGGGTYDSASRTISWSIPVLATTGVHRSKTFTYDAKLAASSTLGTSALTNTATVTGYTSLDDAGRTYSGPAASAAVTPAFPHATITKTVSDAVSYVGAPQTFQVVVTSDGASPAHDIDVTDVLPKSWTFDSATVKVGDADTIPLPPANDAENPQTLEWLDLAPAGLPLGKTIVITYTATPLSGALTDAGAGSAKAHTNTVSVLAEDATGATSGGGSHYNSGPDTATARIHAADLAVTKTAPGTLVAGHEFSWTIAVKNNGGDGAVGPIVVTDTTPANVSNFSLSGTGWTCSSALTVWTCTRPGPIADGASVPTITATGTPDADLASGIEIGNTAKVAAKTYDPTPNTSTVTKSITTRADLAIAKKLSGTLTAGGTATWTLDVTNLGPSTSRGVITVTDALPAGATFVSASGTGWTCTEDEAVVTCLRSAALAAAGAAGQITVKALVPAGQTAAVANTATVGGATPDPVPSNNTDTASTTPTRTADLVLQKSLVSAKPAVPGTELTYDLEVTNAGPSTATEVTITDTLPSYMTYVGGGNAAWDCSAVGRVVTCDLDGSLGVGSANLSNVEIVAAVASGHTGGIVNAAEVVAKEDPTASTDDDTNTPTLKSDLAITKTHTGNATAGRSISYQLQVTNNGPSDTAGPITVEDSVPTGMTYKSATGTGWVCDEDAGTVSCEHPTGLVDGASRSLGLTFDVAVDAGPAAVVNNASVDGPNTDPGAANNTVTDPTTIVDDADVTITKTASAATVHAGANVSWAIEVVNSGPSTADAISVADVLPTGLNAVSISGPGWTCTVASTSCVRASLAPGAAPVITVVTKVGSGVATDTVLTNGASVSTTTAGDDAADNHAEDDVRVTTSADMVLTKTHTGTPIAGEPFTFDLTAHNAGPSNALGPITITDTLPVGMTYVSADAAWSCSAGPVSLSGQDVVCSVVSTGPVVAGADVATLSIVVDIAANQSGSTLVNAAAVSSVTTDPTPGNNADTDTVVPTDEVDLAVTKSHTGPVRIGDDLSFTIGVDNSGPSEARDVELKDVLPKGLTLVSAAGTGWTCATGSPCALDAPLAPGAAAAPLTIVATVTADAYPGVTNVATVSTSSDDVDPANDEASDRVVVPAQVDLSIVKKAETSLRVGEPARYSLTVRNDGPTLDPGAVTVTDQLPDGLTYVGATATGWTCGAVAQLVTCERMGDFAVEASETIDLTVDVGAAAYPAVVNTAQIGSTAEDTDPTDNTSTATAPVAGSALLMIEKSVESQDGDEAVWRISVTNEGPTETTAPITITDKLPDGLAFVSAKGDVFVCADAGRVVTCTFTGALAVDRTISIDVTTRFTADDGAEIVNVASVAGGDVRGGEVLSDDAAVEAPGDGDGILPDGILPDAGGVALWTLLAGLALVLGGVALVRRRGRTI